MITLGTVQTFDYDRVAEPRGLLTSVTDPVGGTMTARYGPDGQLLEQDLPGGVRLAITLDPAGKATARTYTRASDGMLIAASSEVENVRGQTIPTSGPGSNSVFGYDRYGRLTSAQQTASATEFCTGCAYTCDRRSNRTGRASRTGAAPESCPVDGPAETTTHTYDSADRQTDGGYAYNADPVLTASSVRDLWTEVGRWDAVLTELAPVRAALGVPDTPRTGSWWALPPWRTGILGPDPDDRELSEVGRGSVPQRTECAIVRVEQVRMAGEMVVLR